MASIATYPAAVEDPRYTTVYADPESRQFDALHDYYCLECGFEYTAGDSESCPACGSTDVQRSR